MRKQANECIFRTGLTQTELCKHRRWLQTGHFGFRKWGNVLIRVAKTKALINLIHSYCEADLRLCFRICRLLVYYTLGLSGCFRKLFAFKPPIHISLGCYQCLYSNFVTYFGCHGIPKCSIEKGTSRQRSGKGAIRKRFPLQKPRRENPKLTIRYIYHETI